MPTTGLRKPGGSGLPDTRWHHRHQELRTGLLSRRLRPRVELSRNAWDADRAAREKKSWDDAQKAKDDFDRDKALALAALILKQTEERAAQAAEQAERYAQIDAARDAEIQSLIAEADAADAQILTPARRAVVLSRPCGATPAH